MISRVGLGVNKNPQLINQPRVSTQGTEAILSRGAGMGNKKPALVITLPRVFYLPKSFTSFADLAFGSLATTN